MARGRGVFSYADFDLSALLELAERLRRIRCSCDAAIRPQCGSLNWAITLSFCDGVEWIFRCPRKSYSRDISVENTAELLKSEVATMKYIRKNSSIPVPEIFDWSCTSSNKIGIPFILMSKAPGFPLGNFAWDAPPEGMITREKPLPPFTRANKEKIMRQLGEIISQLLALRFDKIGSLIEIDGDFRVHKCLAPALLWHERDSLGDDIPRGPFPADEEYYSSLLSAFLLHVKELPIEQHIFFAPIPRVGEYDNYLQYRAAVDRWNDFVTIGSKIDSSQNRLDYCIAGHFLQQMIPGLTRNQSADIQDSGIQGEGFPLHHPDLSTSNIFIDDEFNITCIIDWAFASTVPIPVLLSTPSFPHPRDTIDTALVPIFQEGFKNHHLQGPNMRQSSKFAIWAETRKAWLFTRLMTMDGLQDYRYFEELCKLVHDVSIGEAQDIPALFKRMEREREFVELREVLEGDDKDRGEVEKEEKEYFRYDKEGREAVARKLDVMRGLSTGFVADERLWRWVEEAVREREDSE